ncbi:MAG: hypothetical protein K0A98_09970 [Trueperaceae bacterium]|nr:hypothetical protein [Trueperaceae bacterium]
MRVRWMPYVLIALVSLWGCGGPPADGGGDDDGVAGYMTPVEAAEHLESLGNDAVAIGNGLINGALGTLMRTVPDPYAVDESLPYLGLAPVLGLAPRMRLPGETTWSLAVGNWSHDEMTGRWRYESGAADVLNVRWRALSDAATENSLSVTWAATTTITLADGSSLSAPTVAEVVAHEGSRQIVDLTLTQDWRATSCGAHEAQRIAIAGSAGDGAAGVTFRDLAVAWSSDDTWALTGGADLRSGSLTVAVDVDTTVSGTLMREETDCTITGAAIDEIDVGLSVTTPVRDASLTGKVALVEVSGGVQVQVSAGRFTVGNRRVDIGGVVPPGTEDPTTTIALTFAEGEVSTLRQFLDRFGLLD